MRQPPGVGTALVADTQILEVLCCACQTVGDADLHKARVAILAQRSRA